MKLYRFLNTINGEWNHRRFQQGRKWFFDKNTALHHWLPLQRDPRDSYYVFIVEVEDIHVYETDQYIDNSIVSIYLDDGKQKGRYVIGGKWDHEGTKQYYVEPKVTIEPDVLTIIPIADMKNFLENQ